MNRPGGGRWALCTHAWAIWLALGGGGAVDGQGTWVIVVEIGLYGGSTVPTGTSTVTRQYCPGPVTDGTCTSSIPAGTDPPVPPGFEPPPCPASDPVIVLPWPSTLVPARAALGAATSAMISATQISRRRMPVPMGARPR